MRLRRSKRGLLFCAFALVLSGCLRPPEDFVRWTAIQASVTGKQADGHLLEMPGGKKLMIDVGNDDGAVAKYLTANGVKSVDDVWISHAHKDHYAGLHPMLDAGIRIGTVHINVPADSVCATEVPWGCDKAHIQKTLERLKAVGTTVVPIQRGETVEAGAARLKVLYAFDGVHTPVGPTDVNDMSVQMMLTVGRTRVLFTGDLNQKMGTYLAENGDGLNADILKVPHHGTESVAPNAFFMRAAPRLAIVPSPQTLWLSERSRRIKDHFDSQKIPTLVTGFNGNIQVHLRSHGFSVHPQFR